MTGHLRHVFYHTNSSFSNSSICFDSLIHNIHGIHDSVDDVSIDLRVAALDTSAIRETAIIEASQQSQQSKPSQPLIIVVSEQDNVDEKFSVYKSRSTCRRRRDDDDNDGISVSSAMPANNDDDNDNNDGGGNGRCRHSGVVRRPCSSDLVEG